jgi:hypothetical protein
MKCSAVRFCVAASCLFLLAPASADTILYDNGPFVNHNGHVISGFQVANSFTLASDSILTGVTIGTWLVSDATPLTVDWSIWDAAGPGGGGNELDGPTTASLLNTFDGRCCGCCDQYKSSFSLPSIALAAGTYWLMLQNATTTNGELDWYLDYARVEHS